MNSHDITVSGSFNVRDLGGYTAGNGTTRWGLTYRSGSMCRVDSDGIKTLHQLGIGKVIDLRSQQERLSHPDPFGADNGIQLINISLFDDLDPTSLKQNNILLDLYTKALQTHGEVFVQVLREIAYTEGGVLFHCTAGKDRTGLIAALLLSVAGVAPDDIIADYALTATRIGPLLEEFSKIIKDQNLSSGHYSPLLECHPETMAKTLAWLDEQYGGALTYLTTNGLNENDLAQLRKRLVEKQIEVAN